MFEYIFSTSPDVILLILRVTVGLVILAHGAQKLLGLFGGYGWNGTMGFFTQQVGLPSVVAALVIIIEFFGSVGLVLGLGTRIAAVGLIAVMIGAVVKGGHTQNGFFMNWFGNQKGEGFEFHLLVIAIAITLLVGGGGLYSVDSLIATIR